MNEMQKSLFFFLLHCSKTITIKMSAAASSQQHQEGSKIIARNGTIEAIAAQSNVHVFDTSIRDSLQLLQTNQLDGLKSYPGGCHISSDNKRFACGFDKDILIYELSSAKKIAEPFC